MTAQIDVVVAGFPRLAEALVASERFGAVHAVASTSGLKSLIASGALSTTHQTVFLFSDTLTVDTPQDVPELTRRLTTNNRTVIVLGTSLLGRGIVEQNPRAGLVEAPFTVNLVLGALAGAGAAFLEPTIDGHTPIPLPQSVSPSDSGGWVTANAPEPQPQAPTQAPPSPTLTPPTVHTPPTAPAPAAAPLRPAPTSSPEQFDRPTPATDSAQFHRPTVTPQPAAPAQFHRPEPASTPSLAPTVAPRSNASYEAFAPTGRRQGKVIVVTSPKGGVGKSTLAINLAAYLGLRLQSAGRRVCMVDANFQQADAGKLLNRYDPSVVSLLRDPSAITPQRIEEHLVHRPDLNASFLLGPPNPKEASPAFFTGEFYTKVVNALRSNFDYIIVDTPVAELFHSILRDFALPSADYVICVIQPALHTLMNADGWLRNITQPRHAGGDDISPEIIGLVLNQAVDGAGMSVERVREELYDWTLIGTVPATVEWLRCLNNHELIATKGYQVISAAFSQILYAATGEASLMEGLAPVEAPRSRGIRDLLGGRRRG